ncbi:MAG TPA: hypothetical protein VGK34_07785 [Armatimonadota bacterium]|jgi:hypothetical protein
MDSELEKIDIIRSRFKVTYDEARNALSTAQGDVVSALASVERSESTDLVALGVEMAGEVQRLVSGGSINKVRVKYGDMLVAEKPVALKAFAAIALGVAAILLSRLVIEVDRDGGEAAS